jgi:hypothetical protein
MRVLLTYRAKTHGEDTTDAPYTSEINTWRRSL